MPRQTYKKIIVTPERLSEVNPENKKLVEKFLKEKATRTSPLTIKGYQSDANIFFVWNSMHNQNKLFVDIKKLELSDFFSFTTSELQYGSARNNRIRSFLSSFSIFIEKFFDDEYPNFRNLVLKTIESVPKEVRREKTILTSDQVEKLLLHLSEKDSQQATWLSLAVYSGSRFAELLRFTTDSIDENNVAFEGLFLETTKQIKTKGRGRSGKMLHKYILKEKFLPYYKKWLSEREIIMKKYGKEHTSIFIDNIGEPIKEGAVRTWISSMEKYLGINLYPHSLRHHLCTELTRKKIPQAFIQFLFGWSSSEMYKIYNDLTEKDMKWELDSLK